MAKTIRTYERVLLEKEIKAAHFKVLEGRIKNLEEEILILRGQIETLSRQPNRFEERSEKALPGKTE